MTVYFAIPTCRPEKCGQTFAKWQAMGYRTAALVDGKNQGLLIENCNVLWNRDVYEGWAKSVNFMARELVRAFNADFVVTGGDDHYPDPNVRAETIAYQITEKFPDSFCVMQPTGDPYSDKIVCTSPWMGRGWITQSYRGEGPLWRGYFHWAVDLELHDVAKEMGVLWQRPDLVQFHDHWQREDPNAKCPEDLKPSLAKIDQDQQLYFSRKAAGFPGHERPLGGPLRELIGDAETGR